MFRPADIIVGASSSEPRLFVEVKNKHDADQVWASRLKRNIEAHYPLSRASYFLVASPDRFFVWKSGASLSSSGPDYEVDAKPIVSRYLSSSSTSEQSLELAVRSWLSDLVRLAERPDAHDTPQWLVTSGLLSALKGTRVLTRSHT